MMQHDDRDPTQPKGRDVSIPLEDLAVTGSILSLVMMAVPLVIYALVYGWSDLLSGWNWYTFLGLAILLIMAHEGVHALGWKFFGGVRWQDLTFGIKWRALAPYCHATAPMPAHGYRIGAALPGIVTGLLPFFYGLAVGSGLWAILGAVLISGAVGDVAVLWIMRDVAPDALVIDHPENAGCVVVTESKR
jgi:ABC-type polysaccharide/polyol phosphate export permease